MKSVLAARIAWRYLLSKKSHGAVGTISTVSVCAMAVATAAIICVLSVFNGFKREIGSRLNTLLPDVAVTPVTGKTFANADSLARAIMTIDGVELATPSLSDNALLLYEGQEMPVTVKGVNPQQFAIITSIRNLIRDNYGSYIVTDSLSDIPDLEPSPAVLSIGVASRLRAYPDSKMLIFAPRREGRVNIANPASSFLTDSLSVKGIYTAESSQFDDDIIIVPIETVRDLLQYDTEGSAIEIKAKSGQDPAKLASRIQEKIGSGYIVKDRLRQQEMNFRMVNIEKWVSFLLLGFILVIASFNVISSLSMLVIEKENVLSTFAAMGLSRRKIGNIFAWESIYVSLSGGVIGIILGISLCLLQQYFGIIKIGGNGNTTILNAYPVEVLPSDILITLIPIIIIGIITALITASFARSRIVKN